MEKLMKLKHQARGVKMGTYGYLSVFLWLISVVIVVPQDKQFFIALSCITVILLVFPAAFRMVLNTRFLFLSLVFVIPPIFFIGEADHSIFGVAYSAEGLLLGLNAWVRFFVVSLAAYGFSRAVDIPSLAGVLERFGLKGLGFSIGVALNLVPSLIEAGVKSWQSLKMRGGLRKRWLRGIQLYLIVVFSNALRKAEEIALAAEARGFSPENSRAMQVSHSRLDWFVAPACILTFIFLLKWI
jgi:energy-coupling factor transporter transmembrane protein EcfT